MLQYERIDISEGIDSNKSNKSKESNIGYKYEPYVCSQCRDLSMVVYGLNDFMILNIKGIDYRCYVLKSRSDAIKLPNNSC